MDSNLLYLQIAIAVAAVLCALALVQKSLSFNQRPWLGWIALALATPGLTYVGLHIPLYFLGQAERIQDHLTVDLMMLGTLGLVLIAILGFAIDHMKERPTWLMIAAAATLAVGIFPLYYRWQQDVLNKQYQITIVQPETLPEIPPAAQQLTGT